MIKWILSDPDAAHYAGEAMKINTRLDSKGRSIPVGFVNKSGDAV